MDKNVHFRMKLAHMFIKFSSTHSSTFYTSSKTFDLAFFNAHTRESQYLSLMYIKVRVPISVQVLKPLTGPIQTRGTL